MTFRPDSIARIISTGLLTLSLAIPATELAPTKTERFKRQHRNPGYDATAWQGMDNINILSSRQKTLTTNNKNWYWVNPRPTGENLGQSFFFNDGQEGWVTINGGQGLLHTVNGGRSWARASFGPAYGFLTVYFSDQNHGWAGGNGSTSFNIDNQKAVIWATTDGGKTWVQQYEYTIDSGVTGVGRIQFVNNQIGYAVGANGLALKTTDGGSHWSGITLPPEVTDKKIDLTGLKVISSDVLWAVGQHQNGIDIPPDTMIIKSENGGQQWIAEPITDLGSGFMTTIDALDSKIAWIGGQSRNISRTTDGGLTWANIPLPQPTGSHVVGMTMQGPYLGFLALSDGRVLSTSDSGTTWDVRAVIPSGVPTGMTFGNSMDGFVVTNIGTTYLTNNGGLSWSTSGNGAFENLWALSFSSPTVGWACGDFGTMLKTTNAGKTWTPLTTPTQNDLHAISFSDNRNGWAVGENGTALSTQNGGKSWTPLNTGVTGMLNSVAFTDKLKGWAVSSNTLDTMIATRDGGQTWQSVKPPISNVYIGKVYFFDKAHGWATANTYNLDEPAYVLYTQDGGATWKDSVIIKGSEGFISSVEAISFVSPTEGWATGVTGSDDIAGVVYHTSDGGVTWAEQSLRETPNGLMYEIKFIDKNRGILFGSTGNMNWITTDGGQTWDEQTAFHTGQSNATFAVAFPNKGTAVAVGTGAAIMRSDTAGGLIKK